MTQTEKPRPAFIVTIDGPAGTGKSSTAQELAARLGFDFLDTGAMYRAAVVIALEEGLDLTDGQAIADAVRRIGVQLDLDQSPPKVYAGMLDVTAQIRGTEVSSFVSPVSAHPELRQVLVEEQRRLARQYGQVVTEGRDQGTVVFPEAAVKFYLDADPAVRATRRATQLRLSGRADVDQARILADIQERDRRDSTRADGPLRCPPDAYRLDTSLFTLREVVDRLERIVRERLAQVTLGEVGDQPHEDRRA